jgi:hypothetical protein
MLRGQVLARPGPEAGNVHSDSLKKYGNEPPFLTEERLEQVFRGYFGVAETAGGFERSLERLL